MEESKPWGMEVNTFTMLMHFSQFAGFVIPGVGIVLPIIMWAANKDQSEIIDQHGKVILNWIISLFIYSLICVPLVFLFVGIIGLIALALMGIIFAIIGAIKANEGTLWEYPLSIKFFKF